MSLIVEKGTEILCVKFVNVGGFDYVREHNQILSKKGFVWFGKI